MYPVLLAFRFPDFLSQIHWLEIGLTLVLAAGLYLWRSRRPEFDRRGFTFWLGAYALLRYLAWYAGPGYEFKLHTYGVAIALAFVFAILVAMRQARREGIPPDMVLDLSFWILLSSMIGSRVLFILVNIQDYLADPILLLKVWQGGLVFYGGFLGAFLAVWILCRRWDISFLRIADLFVPSVALGHVFGRLGCYSAGCCHGKPTGIEGFGAVFHASGSVVARNNLLGVPLHPTQLYEAAGELLIFSLLLLMRKRKRFHGQLLTAYLLMYPVLRSVNEMFRGDTERGMLLQIDLFGDAAPELLSVSQLISLGLALGAAGLLVWVLRLKARAEATPTPPVAL